MNTPQKLIILACLSLVAGCNGNRSGSPAAVGTMDHSTGIIVHVSADGTDAGTGSAEAPFASIEQARDLFRNIRKSDPASMENGALVLIQGGTYRLDKGIVLTPQDSGTATAPVIYRSYPDQRASFAGGPEWRLSDFEPMTDPAALAKIPVEARPFVRQINLRAQGFKDYGSLPLYGHSMSFLEKMTNYRRGTKAPELFFDGEPMTLSRYPNEGFTEVGSVIEGGDVIRAWMEDARGGKVMEHEWVPESERNNPPRGFAFTYDNDKLASWAGAEDVRMYGYWYYNWSDQSVTVASIDPENGIIHSVEPSAYSLRSGQRFYVFNLLEELDSPGEWYLDRSDGMLYFYPPSENPDSRINLSLLEGSLLTVQGADNLIFEGIDFGFTRGGGIDIKDSRNVQMMNCRVGNTGRDGIIVDEGRQNRIAGCEVFNTGRAGILLDGGNVTTLEPAGHVVENTLVHHFARVEKTYNPGIGLKGVGQIARNNELHSAAHMAILFGGNNHLIELNHIHDVVRESDDMSAIYAGRSWVDRGTVIRHNLLRNISGYKQGTHLPSAIYLDDGLSGTVVEGNILINVAQGMMFNGGRDNVVRSNVFIDTQKTMRYTNMREAYQTWAAMSWRTLWKNLKAAPIDSPVWRAAYPELATLAEDEPDLPMYNVIRGNLLFNSPWVSGTAGVHEAVEELGEIEQNVESDVRPGDFDPATGKFTFAEASGIFERVPGLRNIPVDRIGRLGN